MTLLDYFAAHAPIDAAFANEEFYKANGRNASISELYFTLANLRTGYAEAMLKAQGLVRELKAATDLIAAAPDLLEVAISNAEYRAARDHEFGRGYNAAKNGQRRDVQKESADWYAGYDSRAAIAKATGAPHA